MFTHGYSGNIIFLSTKDTKSLCIYFLCLSWTNSFLFHELPLLAVVANFATTASKGSPFEVYILKTWGSGVILGFNNDPDIVQ